MFRSLFLRKNLTVRTGPITVTRALIDGQQVNPIYVVNVNQQFSLIVMPIDRITRRKLGLIQWSNWRWSAIVTQKFLPMYNRLGSLFTNSSSRININLITGLITIPNHWFNSTGMFMCTIRLISSNNEHDFQLNSNAILVKESRMNFVTDPQSFSSNITFDGDYDQLNSTDQLETKRAMIYNYLLSIGMPIISDLILIKG